MKKQSVYDVLNRIRSRRPIKPCRKDFLDGYLIYTTNKVAATVKPQIIKRALERFRQCDWGNVSPQDTKKNNAATHAHEGQIFAAYQAPSGVEFWVQADVAHGKAIVMLAREAM